MATRNVVNVEPDQYAKDLLALRRHARVIASYLRDAGVEAFQVRGMLHAIMDAGLEDAAQS